MKLLCFIDLLGSGGAQRQLATLAVGLKKRGHEVRFLIYHPHAHFRPLLEAADIPCQLISPCSHLQRALTIRRILRQGWQDVVLAFLEGPCLYAELARLPRPRWGLVAGERLADPKIKSKSGQWLRQGHRLADAVVTNSHTNRLMLADSLPFLKGKLTTVYNMVDLELFRPVLAVSTAEKPGTKTFRIVVAASYQEKKNMMGVARALLSLKQSQSNPKVVVDWFGAMPSDPTPFKNVERFIKENGLVESFRLHPATQAIAEEFSRADAVGLFSFYEGLPNAVCEGMACGKPILLSHVCDAGNLVADGRNGFLCDPSSPESIANSISRLAATSQTARQQMGAESRAMAERFFNERGILESYETILQAVVRQEPIPTNCVQFNGV